jgi:uncharacterized membrane protein YkvA (DUF1232 family)
MLQAIKAQAKQLKKLSLTVYFAARDPRMPWHVRILAICVAAYAFSPIDLIPDFIPILGLLDDLLLLPLGIALVVKLTPADILETAKKRALYASEKPVSKLAAFVIMIIWLVMFALLCWYILRLYR